MKNKLKGKGDKGLTPAGIALLTIGGAAAALSVVSCPQDPTPPAPTAVPENPVDFLGKTVVVESDNSEVIGVFENVARLMDESLPAEAVTRIMPGLEKGIRIQIVDYSINSPGGGIPGWKAVYPNIVRFNITDILTMSDVPSGVANAFIDIAEGTYNTVAKNIIKFRNPEAKLAALEHKKATQGFLAAQKASGIVL